METIGIVEVVRKQLQKKGRNEEQDVSKNKLLNKMEWSDEVRTDKKGRER